MRLFPAATLALIVFAALPAHAILVSLDAGAPINESTGQILLNASVLQATGTKYVRVNFILGPWSTPNDNTLRGPQNLTWKQTYDQIINNIKAQGMEVYGLISAQAVHSSAGGNYNTQQWLNDYTANFTTIVGQFKDRVRIFESFNEPNNWVAPNTPALSPGSFAQSLINIYQAVKISNGHSGDPSWQVTLLSGPPFSHDSDTAATYMQQTYQAGINSYGWNTFKNNFGTYPMDGFAYHIYVQLGSSNPSVITNAENTNLNAFWSAITGFEGSGTAKKLWISEWGWNTINQVTEAQQASNLTLVFNLYKNDSRIALANWFQLQDFGTTDNWGLYRQGALIEANKKASWQAFRNFAVAQVQYGILQGTIRDNLGNALSGAIVASSEGGYSATTNASGFYQIANVMPAIYSLTAKKFGYKAKTQNATISANQTTTSDFSLQQPVNVTTPSQAKTKIPGTFIRLDNMIVTAAFTGDRIYVEDINRASGIGVSGASASVGDKVSVTGIMLTIDGERVISSPDMHTNQTNQTVPKPLGASGYMLGGETYSGQIGVVDDAGALPAKMATGQSNVGLLMQHTGTVSNVDSGTNIFYVDDGTGLIDGSGNVGVRVLATSLPLPAVGNIVRITGPLGVTKIGAYNVRLLRPRTSADIYKLYPSSVQPTVTNPSFETGILSPWVAYGSTDGIITGSWFGDIVPRTGTRFVGCAANEGIRQGGFRQQVAAIPGQAYSANAYSRVYRAGNNTNSTRSRVGLDRTGGTDPASANIVWSAWDSQPTAYYSQWNLLTSPSAVATGSTVTIYLDFSQSENPGWHINAFDDAGLTAN